MSNETLMDRSVDAAQIGENLSHDLSAWGLFLAADPVVKLVMLMLVGASIWCWTIIVEKIRTLGTTNKRANRFEESFWSGEPLDKLYERVRNSKSDPMLRAFVAGMEEWRLGMSEGQRNSETFRARLPQRIERTMTVAAGKEMDKLEKNMTFLANVGSAAPFVGLFGTVWGIMSSFSAIAGTQNTSLAVVAPGIAEALFATALGLVAAIPAVIAYNKFSNDLNRYGDRLDVFITEFLAILTRHLDKQHSSKASDDAQASAKKSEAA